jgi:Ni,Fe-hydrogenase maturation factor
MSLKELEKRITQLETRHTQGESVIIIDGEPQPEQLERIRKENPGAVIIIDNIPDDEI